VHSRRKGRYGCACETLNSVPRRPRASGQVERIERLVQGDCASPQQLRLGRGLRADAGGDTVRINTMVASIDLSQRS
jgi:hypothetical protein